ncbi:MAG: sigma-70 family RNA polymerase sigma factor [Lachnospiraceae bacterium]|nr:sigma-70 family RNA polymerase sigma factor [Lachnospiraceae bacterium]
MAQINLRDYYPDFYNEDYIIEAPEEVLLVMQESKRMEAAYQRKRYRYKAHYSLDCKDGIEQEALLHVPTPQEVFEEMERQEQISRAISCLPKKQAQRIRAHFILGMTVSEIAEMEGVAKSRISESLSLGLHHLLILLKKME